MRCLALLLALFLPALAWADLWNDGPYVMHEGKGSRAYWVCASQLIEQALSPGQTIGSPCSGEQTRVTLNALNPVAPDRLPGVPRWAAVSDIHGQAGIFVQLLCAQGIVDASGNWAWGKGVLVIAGDVFDRGPTVTEALWQIYRLEQQARAVGGDVQFVLGNHETMVLRGDLRYLHPKYPAVAQLIGRRYDQLYGADTELGRWLRSRATVFQLGDTVFLHGGLHPELAQREIDLAAINQTFRRRLGASKEALAQDEEANYLFGRHGPVWYRGYFLPERATLAQVNALLARLDARRIVVGHTTQSEVLSLYGGRIIGIDAGIKDGERGELLLWQDGQLWRGLMDGSRLPLPPGSDDGSVAQASR